MLDASIAAAWAFEDEDHPNDDIHATLMFAATGALIATVVSRRTQRGT